MASFRLDNMAGQSILSKFSKSQVYFLHLQANLQLSLLPFMLSEIYQEFPSLRKTIEQYLKNTSKRYSRLWLMIFQYLLSRKSLFHSKSLSFLLYLIQSLGCGNGV